MPNGGAGKQAKPQADPPTQAELKWRKEAEPDTSEVELRWVVSDYRNVNGLNLPHRLTRAIGGQLTEEIEIQKVKINPALKPDKFEKKEKQK